MPRKIIGLPGGCSRSIGKCPTEEGKGARAVTLRSCDMSKASWSIEAKKTFALFAALNWPFGLWPLLQPDLRLKIRMSIAVVQVLLMLASTSYEMYRNCGDAEDSLDNLLVMASGLISLSKITMYHMHREKLRTNVVSALDDWSSAEATIYRSLMKSYESIYKKITFLLLAAVVWCGSLYFLKVILIDADEIVEAKSDDNRSNVTRLVLKKRYLFPSTCTLNDVSDAIHLFLVLNQLVQLVTCCTVAVGSDAFFLAITTHLCGQFEILKIRFAAVGQEEDPLVTKNSEKLVYLISRHQHLLHLSELLEAAYNKIVLAQLITSVTLISVAGFSFLIALKTSDFFGSIKSLVVMQYMLLQSFMYTCIGESLQSQSNDITQSVYDGSWYKLPMKFSKNLVFVMMRSNASPHLTAGKFFDMTRSTFMDVVKTSSSYLSILRIMLNE